MSLNHFEGNHFQANHYSFSVLDVEVQIEFGGGGPVGGEVVWFPEREPTKYIKVTIKYKDKEWYQKIDLRYLPKISNITARLIKSIKLTPIISVSFNGMKKLIQNVIIKVKRK